MVVAHSLHAVVAVVYAPVSHWSSARLAAADAVVAGAAFLATLVR